MGPQPLVNFPLMVDSQISLHLLRHETLTRHYTLLQANREHIGQWEDWVWTTTREEQRRFIQTSLERYAAGEGFAAAIWYQQDASQLLDLVGCITALAFAPQTVELGYWLSQTHTGRGIMTRSLRCLIPRLFVANVNRLLLSITADNRSSRAVAERLGFTCDGVLRQNAMLKNAYVDRAIYTLLACDYSDRPGMIG